MMKGDRNVIFFMIVILVSLISSSLCLAQDATAPAAGGVPAGGEVSLQDFQQMTPQDQATYLSQTYNPQLAADFFSKDSNVGLNPNVDQQYFGDVSNVGKNPSADKKFFEGDYSGVSKTSLRDFLKGKLQHKKAAEKYFKDPPMTFSEIASDFSYDPRAKTFTNNEMTVPLGDKSIIGITSTADGFKILRKKEGQEQEITVGGGAERTLSFDSETGEVQFTDPQGGVQNFNIPERSTTDQKEPSKTSFDFQPDGTLKVSGPVSGETSIKDDFAVFSNFAGDLVIKPNGDIDAHNARVRTSQFFGDGNFEKKGNTVKAWDHGAKNLGNLDLNGRTVIIDIPSRVGAKTQNGEGTLTVHLSEISKKSVFYAGPQQEKPQPTTKELLDLARKVKPPSGNLGKDAEVFIKRNEQGIVTVTAKGRVDVGFYDISSRGHATISKREPHFKGENGISEFDMQSGPKTQVIVRGKAQYDDSQYMALSGKGYGIKSMQDGSVMQIIRNDVTSEDALFVDCYECSAGKVVDIQKTIAVAKPTGVTGVLGEPEFLSAGFSVKATANGLVYDHSMVDLGAIARHQTEGEEIVLGRDMVMKIPASSCAKAQECNFRMARNKEGSLRAQYEVYDAQGKVSKTIPIDTGVGKVLGNVVILASDDNVASFEKLVKSIEEKDYKSLKDLSFKDDPALRQMILQQTGLDIANLDNPEYSNRMIKVLERRSKVDRWIEKLAGKGINLDSNGRPQTAEDQQKLNSILSKRRSGEFWWYTAAMINLAKADTEQAEATYASCAGDAGCPVSSEKLAEIQAGNKETVSSLGRSRKQAQKESEQREAIKLQRAMAGGPDGESAKGQATKLGSEKRKSEHEVAKAAGWEQTSKQRIAGYKKQIAELEKAGLLSKAWGSFSIMDSMTERENVEALLAAEERALKTFQNQKAAAERRTIGIEEQLGKLTAKYESEQPIFAAELKQLSGDTAGAQETIKSSGLSAGTQKKLLEGRYSGMTGLVIAEQAESMADLGDLAGVAEIVNQLAKGDRNSVAFKRANAAYNQAQQREGFDQAYAAGKMERDKKQAFVDRNGYGFLNLGFIVERSAFNPVNLYAGVTGTDSWGDAQDRIDQQSMKNLGKQRQNFELRNQVLNAYQKAGLTAAEAFSDMAHGKLNPAAVAKDPKLQGKAGVVDTSEITSQVLSKQARGEQLSKKDMSELAWHNMENRRRNFNDGTYDGAALQSFSNQYHDTELGAHAYNQKRAIETTRADYTFVSMANVDEQGKLAMGIAGDLTAVLPGVAFARGFTTVAAAGKRVADATRLSAVAGRMAAKSKIIFASRGAKLALSHADEAFKLADKTGDLHQIKRAESALLSARKAAQAESKLTVSKSFLTKDLHISSDIRQLEKTRIQHLDELSQAQTKLAAAEKAGDVPVKLEIYKSRVAAAAEKVKVVERHQEVVKLADRTKTWYRGTTVGKKNAALINKNSPEAIKAQKALDRLETSRKSYRLHRKAYGVKDIPTDVVDDVIKASKEADEAVKSLGTIKITTNRLRAARAKKEVEQLRKAGYTVEIADEGVSVTGMTKMKASQREVAEKAIEKVNKLMEDPSVAARVKAKEFDSAADAAKLDNVQPGAVAPAEQLTAAEAEYLEGLVKELSESGVSLKSNGVISVVPETVPAGMAGKADEANRLLSKVDSGAATEARVNSMLDDAVMDSDFAAAHRVKEDLAAQRAGAGADVLPAVAGDDVARVTPPRRQPTVVAAAGDDVPLPQTVEDAYGTAVTGVQRAAPSSTPVPPGTVKVGDTVDVATDAGRVRGKVVGKNGVVQVEALGGVQSVDEGKVVFRAKTVEGEKRVAGFLDDAENLRGTEVKVKTSTGNTVQGKVMAMDDDFVYLDDLGQRRMIPRKNLADVETVLPSASLQGPALSPKLLAAEAVEHQKVLDDFKDLRELNKKFVKGEKLSPQEQEKLAKLKDEYFTSSDHRELAKIDAEMASRPTPKDEKGVKSLQKEFKKKYEDLEDRVIFREGIKRTNPSDHANLVRDYFGTSDLGKMNVGLYGGSPEQVASQIGTNAREVIDYYKKGFVTKGGQRIEITASQEHLLREMAEMEIRLLSEAAAQKGGLKAIADARKVSVDDLVRTFNDDLMDGLQHMVIHDGVVMKVGDDSFRIGTGLARLRESNGLDHVVGNQLRALEMMQASKEFQALTPLQKLEVLETMRYHDLAKGSLWNNAQKMQDLGKAGELSKSHTAASGLYINKNKANLKVKYGDDGFMRIKQLSSHHDSGRFFKITDDMSELEKMRAVQFNAVTVADNMAGVQVIGSDGLPVADKVIEAIERVPGNEEILSKALSLNEGKGWDHLPDGPGIFKGKPVKNVRDAQKAHAIESLRKKALSNIDDALKRGEITPEFAQAASGAIEDDFGLYAAATMRRTKASGVSSVTSDAGKIIVEHKPSKLADNLDSVHEGLKYDSAKGTTDAYWDKVIIRPKTKNADDLFTQGSCDNCFTFEIGSGNDGLVTMVVDGKPLPVINPATGKQFTRKAWAKQLGKQMDGVGYELHSAQKHLDDPLSGSGKNAKRWTDADGEKAVGLEHRFLDSTSTPSSSQRKFLSEAQENKVVSDTIESIQKSVDDILELDDVDFSDPAALRDLEDRVLGGGYDLRVGDDTFKGTPDEISQKLQSIRDDFINKQWDQYYGGEKLDPWLQTKVDDYRSTLPELPGEMVPTSSPAFTISDEAVHTAEEALLGVGLGAIIKKGQKAIKVSKIAKKQKGRAEKISQADESGLIEEIDSEPLGEFTDESIISQSDEPINGQFDETEESIAVTMPEPPPQIVS